MMKEENFRELVRRMREAQKNYFRTRAKLEQDIFEARQEGIRDGIASVKPAEWSDTNELVFKDICNHLKEEGYNGWIVLLNALRNGEFQPKQEWSDEDEKIVNNIVAVLGQYIDYKSVSGTGSGYATPRYAKEIDWLNSLRPSWKPSEEHLSALLAVFNDPNNIGSQTCQLALTDLYEQLKKL